jgi:hypothetical protein
MVLLVVSVCLFPAVEALQAWRERAARALADKVYEPYRRYYDLTASVQRAARSPDPQLVRSTRAAAEEILRVAASNSLRYDFWNQGNAIHYGHLLLGRIALLDGNVVEARARLLRAGSTPGSPQLDDYGPDMTLAEELLLRGEREVVLKYFAECERFWVNKSRNRLAEWSEAVRAGKRPDFGRRSGLPPAKPSSAVKGAV